MNDEFNELDNLDYLEDEVIYDEDYDNYYDDDFDTEIDEYDDDYTISDSEDYKYEDNLELDENYQYNEIESENDDKLEKTINLRNKMIRIFLIILLLIIIILLSSVFIKSFISKNKNEKDEVTVTKKEKENYDEIFSLMKNACINYYDQEKIDNDEILTLKKMKELSLIKTVDENYDDENSIAYIKKKDDNYELTINVKYNNIKKTKTYILGHYSYCTNTYLCEKDETLENETYLYEYSKEGKVTLSNWSSWSNYVNTSCTTKNISCDTDDMNCLTEIKVIQKEEKSGTKNKYYINYRSAFQTNQKEVRKVCSNFDYIKINGVYYRTEKNSNYKMLGAIKKTTMANYYNFRYDGRYSYQNPPNDTIATRFVFVGPDYSNCKDTCDGKIKYYYDAYTFTKSLTKVSNPELDCNNSTTIVIPNYSITKQKITVNFEEPQYQTVCYKTTRTRTKQNDSDTVWSKEDDSKLLDNGYTYTGNKKLS